MGEYLLFIFYCAVKPQGHSRKGVFMKIRKEIRVFAVVIVLLMLVMLAPNVHAIGDAGYYGIGLLLGGGIIAGATALVFTPEEDMYGPLMITGAVSAGTGLFVLGLDALMEMVDASPKNPDGIYLVSNEEGSGEWQLLPEKKKKNPVIDFLRHLMVGGAKNKFYIGLSYDF